MKRLIGFILGIVLAVVFVAVPQMTPALPVEGQRCLGISLLAVVWWATGVCHPGYTSILMLTLYVLCGVAGPDKVFALWTRPIPYLVVGGYLIAAAVRDSGLGKRVAFIYASNFISSYKSLVVGAYVLGAVLSLLIPHPWPRSFLIMSVLLVITRAANMSVKDTANVGLAVFGGSAANSMILLTGDSITNMFTVDYASFAVSWLGWLKIMAVPGIVVTVLTCLLQLAIYKPEGNFVLDKGAIKAQLAEMGPVRGKELHCLVWMVLAILAWVTGGGIVHNVNPGWIALLAAVAMSLPYVGTVLTPASWGDVSIATLFFLTAALGIGSVGNLSGMNKWLADVLLPSTVPSNAFVFAALLTTISIVLHMCLGSVLAIMGIAIPTFVTFAKQAGIEPLVPALIVFMAIATHYVLPFHHMNVLVGVGEKQGMYGDKEVIRLGIPLTVVVYITTVLVMVPWFKLIGMWDIVNPAK